MKIIEYEVPSSVRERFAMVFTWAFWVDYISTLIFYGIVAYICFSGATLGVTLFAEQFAKNLPTLCAAYNLK